MLESNALFIVVEIDIGNRIWNGMHYNIVTPDNGGGGWNGFSTLAEFYDLFEGDTNELEGNYRWYDAVEQWNIPSGGYFIVDSF